MGMIFEGSTLSIQVSSGPETRTHICSQQQAEMSKSWSTLAFCLAIVTLSVLALATAQPYESELGYGNGDEAAAELDYLDSIRDLIHQTPKRVSWMPRPLTSRDTIIRNGKRFFFGNEYVKRRLCIPPQMSCNTLPNSCCGDTTCRCNLWGQNCRCLRMGLFQRWGRK